MVYFTKTKYPVFVCMTNDISFIPYKLWIFDSLNQRLDFSTLKTISSSSSSRLKIILQHHDFRKGNNIIHKHPSFKKKLSSEVTKFTDNFNELMDKLVTFDGNFISFQLVLFDRCSLFKFCSIFSAGMYRLGIYLKSTVIWSSTSWIIKCKYCCFKHLNLTKGR